MKKILLAVLLMVFAFNVNAQMGKRFPSEKQLITDPSTGIPITVLTSPDKNDRFPYQTDPMWTADGKYIVFRSSSRYTEPGGDKDKGTNCIYFIEELTGEIIQATDDSSVGSSYLAHNSNRMFYMRSDGGKYGLYVLDLDLLFEDSKSGNIKERSFYEKKVGDISAEWGIPREIAVDCTDDYAYFVVERPVSEEERKKAVAIVYSNPNTVNILCGIRKMDLKTGEISMILDADFRIGHIQTNLFKSGEITYCHETGGDAPQRMWFCTADGKINRPLYKETPLDWVTHETFANENYVYFCLVGFSNELRKQATGIVRINLRTDDIEFLGQADIDKDYSPNSNIKGRGFWHCNASRDGKWAIGDTYAGNIWLINIATGERHLLVSHIPMSPDHGHPYISPDNKRVLFQSGYLSKGERIQLMMVNIPTYFN